MVAIQDFELVPIVEMHSAADLQFPQELDLRPVHAPISVTRQVAGKGKIEHELQPINLIALSTRRYLNEYVDITKELLAR